MRGISPIGSGYAKSRGGIFVPGSDAAPFFANNLSTLFETASSTTVDIGEPSDMVVDLTSHEMTISLWFNCSSLAAQNYLFSKSNLTTPAVAYTLGTVNTALFGYFGNLSSTSGGVLTTGTWFHALWTVRNVAGTFTGSIWLNGTQVGGNLTAGNTTIPGVTIRIGSGNGNAGAISNPSNANIDEVTVWNAGFVSADITALYNGNKPFDPRRHSKAANLIHWWRMGDTDVYPTITDRIGTANGTCTNMTSAAHNFVASHP